MKLNTKILQRTDALLMSVQDKYLSSLTWQYEVTTDPFEEETGYLYRISYRGKCMHLFLTESNYKNVGPDLILYCFLGRDETDNDF